MASSAFVGSRVVPKLGVARKRHPEQKRIAARILNSVLPWDFNGDDVLKLENPVQVPRCAHTFSQPISPGPPPPTSSVKVMPWATLVVANVVLSMIAVGALVVLWWVPR